MTNALVRLELYSALRARWFVAAILLAAGLVGLFLIVATRESSVIGFTGFGRVLSGVVQASLLFVPLLSLFATTQAVTGARQSGVLEWYLSYPNSRERCFWALYLPRLATVLAPMVGAVVLLGLAARLQGQSVSIGLLATFLALLTGQAFCFASAGMASSSLARSPEQALLGALIVWMCAAILVDFAVLGLLLRWDLPPQAVFFLAGINPVQAGRLGMLAQVDPQLGILGPVGTWMTTTLGPGLTLAYGLGWPIVLGAALLLLARGVFLRRDAQ